eukprot:TRINITY_DN8347_c0_g1_i3.p1 TRINITY_DN8347_c0_g1~~TRINITY_DN8347_c0_g1_i3.p1  ORF type:complete len:297 (-),score=35.21 TRINITY_DN8347_c0_g1_i3:218-985(-)
MAEVSLPVPASVTDLKLALEAETGIRRTLQQLLDGERILEDEEQLQHGAELTFILDERPFFSWDIKGNPAKAHIEGDGGHLLSPNLQTDFVNVLAQEPVTEGTHYFEFVVHRVQDEQWCGMAHDKSQAGRSAHGSTLLGRFYYFSIRGTEGVIKGDRGRILQEVDQPVDGDTIGMIVKVETGEVAFALNGRFQGQVLVERPGEPLYFFTTVDRPGDHMELRKPPLSEAAFELVDSSSWLSVLPSRDRRPPAAQSY